MIRDPGGGARCGRLAPSGSRRAWVAATRPGAGGCGGVGCVAARRARVRPGHDDRAPRRGRLVRRGGRGAARSTIDDRRIGRAGNTWQNPVDLIEGSETGDVDPDGCGGGGPQPP
jgi:hypothetical protein